MTSRERLLAALDRRMPDRLPVTTHHLMPSYLAGAGFASEMAFFDRYGLDAIRWLTPLVPDGARAVVKDPSTRAFESWSFASDEWRVEREDVAHDRFITTRYRCVTPSGTLSMVLQDDGRTVWVAERLVKNKADIDVIGRHAPVPLCDPDPVREAVSAIGPRGIVRGAVPGFALYGQPGCWQDAAVLFGTVELIMATFDDPEWVLSLLAILRDRKLAFLESTSGAPFDVLELGGGDASSTVISPSIFDRFVAPFDAPLIEAAHSAGQRIVYHTCGGMMPFLERLADMKPDALETLTPPEMGGDMRLAEAKARVGERVCLVGGFDQVHHLAGCSPDETRRAVRACFDQAGAGGGFILAPSDHFFEAEGHLLKALGDEARRCVYATSS
jgi:hypothetical protein